MTRNFSMHPLPAPCAQRYAGMAFDGCLYYMTLTGENQIVVLDNAFCPKKCVDTCRAYSAICFDAEENCFWAYAPAFCGRLFQLNTCLQEIDCLPLCVPGKCTVMITGLSACCGCDGLLASSTDQILCVDKQTGKAEVWHREWGNNMVSSVVCAPPYFFYTVLRDVGQRLVVLTQDGKHRQEIPIPEGCWIKSALLYPCKDDGGSYHLYLLGVKHGCYSYRLNLRLDSYLSGTLCPCNEALCQVCRECDCQTPCCCMPPVCSHQACNDIVESIALQEAALAHILNAEGEKIQKAVAESSDVCELLAVNESVQKTLVRATHLEQVLYAKLEAIHSYCDGEPSGCDFSCPPLPCGETGFGASPL